MFPDTTTVAFPAMGGTVEIQLPIEAAGQESAIKRLFEEHERTISRFLLDSELSALNASAGSAFAASPLLFDVVSEACGWACITGGVFDPTVIDVLEASGYDRPFERIGETVMVAERPRTRPARWREIAFDFERDVITLPRDVRIDLGGIGKGYTVDRAIEALPAESTAMVNASGDLYAAGDGPEGDGWRIGIADPFEPERDLAVIVVHDRGVATSGSSRRRWGADARYHHLIDPRAGRSSETDLLSVTVIAASATEADVLAKTAFLMGGEAGQRFVEARDGAASLAITLHGDVLISERFAEYLA